MSIKFDRGASEGKYLGTDSWPSGIATTDNVTVFCWIKAPASKGFHILALSSGDPGYVLDKHSAMYQESNNAYHNYVLIYNGAGGDAVQANFPGNTWVGYLGTATLGGRATIQVTGGTKYTTGSNMSSAWAAVPAYFRLGAAANNEGNTASLIFRLAHICVWDKVLSDANQAALLAGANPLAIDAANIIEYWSGVSLTGLNSTVLTERGTGGTITVNDSDNPTVDDPPSAEVEKFRIPTTAADGVSRKLWVFTDATLATALVSNQTVVASGGYFTYESSAGVVGQTYPAILATFGADASANASGGPCWATVIEE